MTDHENIAAELRDEMGQRQSISKDMAGGELGKETKAIDAPRSLTGSDMEKGSNYETPDGDEPTEYEKSTLEHIGEKIPKTAFLIAIVELCERFSYYGSQGILQNYIMLAPDQGRHGLGQGHMAATGLTTFYQFWCYVTPIGGAIIADQYLGRYKTILVFTMVYIVGLLILWTTALPAAMDAGAGLGGLVAAILLIGIGTGGIKSNIAPLIADQYQRRVPAIGRHPKTGARVILDPAITIQRIYMIFYWCINVGALSLLATPYMEQDIGFWSAYLLCFCMFFVALAVIVFGRKHYIVRAPEGSIITNAFRCIWIMVKNRDSNAPKATWQEEHGKTNVIRWDDKFVEEVKRALVACKVFTFFPIYWVVYGQFSNNFVTQAFQMASHGIPNDLMSNFDPIAIIVFLPILDRIVYPMMRKAGIGFPPINRITFGFWVGALAMAYAAVLQKAIYNTGPCYGQPAECAAGKVDGEYAGNNIHIAIQAPAYMLIGISEIFASVTGLEYAYTKAPPSMKSFVQSMFLLTSAFGSAIGEAFVPLTGNPQIMYLFAGLAVGSFLAGCALWALFHKYNNTEEEMNSLG